MQNVSGWSVSEGRLTTGQELTNSGERTSELSSLKCHFQKKPTQSLMNITMSILLIVRLNLKTGSLRSQGPHSAKLQHSSVENSKRAGHFKLFFVMSMASRTCEPAIRGLQIHLQLYHTISVSPPRLKRAS